MLKMGDVVRYQNGNKRIGIVEKSPSGRLRVRYILTSADPNNNKLSHFHWNYETISTEEIANSLINHEWIGI